MSKASLHAIEPEPPVSLDIFERLTEICEATRDGKISSVGIAVVYRDGSTGTCWSTSPSVGLLVAAVTRLQHRLLTVMDE